MCMNLSFKQFFLESSYRGEHLAPDKDFAPDYDLNSMLRIMEKGDYVLIHKFVPVSTIFTNGDSIKMEWGYYPS